MSSSDSTRTTSNDQFEPGFEEKLRCLFCGGATCRRCGEDAYLQQDSPAIRCLHSTWITESILAMQRPSDCIIHKSLLIPQFQSNRITAIFNLTEAGEHPYCGHGNLKSSGFPYTPELFMGAGSSYTEFTIVLILLDKCVFAVLPLYIFQSNISTSHGLI